MAQENLNILANQAWIDLGGDPTELGEPFQWDNQGHMHLLEKLGDRVTQEKPLRLICKKELTKSDVNPHYGRLVIKKDDAEGNFFKCLTLDQRYEVTSGTAGISIVGHDRCGETWDLKFKSWSQGQGQRQLYVIAGSWGAMAKENGWKEGSTIHIWGFPYMSVRDGWMFGQEVHLVFTNDRDHVP